MIVAETPRLTVRCVAMDAAGALAGVLGDAEVRRLGEGGVESNAWVRRWLARCLEHRCATTPLHHYPTQGHGPYGVVARWSGQTVG
jgi:hypothetical protein